MKYFQIHLRLKSWIPILLFFMTLIHSTIQIKFKASPCPKKFSYEPRDSNEDRWYGDVTLPIDGTIEGSTIRLGLDRPSQLLVTTAGPISTNDNKVYIVTHDNVVLEKGSTYKLTFMVKFDKNNTIPMLETIHFNGRRICPEQSPLPLDSGNNEYPSTSRPDPKGTEATDVFSDIDKRPNNPTRTTTRATFVNNNNEDNFNFNSENSNINRFTTSRTTTTNSFNNGGSNLNNLGFNNGGTGNQGNTGFNSGTSNNFGGNPNNFGSSSNLNGNSNVNQGNSGFGTSDSTFGNTGNFGTNSNSNANQGNNGFGTSNSNFGGNTGTFGSNSNSHSNQGGTALNQNFGENNSNFGGNGNSNFGTNGNTNQGTFGQNNFGGSGGAQGNGIREPNQGINSFNTGSSSNVGNNGGSNFNNGNSNNFNGNQASASDQVACGTVSIANPLITLAQNTQYGQWPWHAALFMRDEFNASKSSYICGGSLVSKNKVITAAHCVSSSGNRIVNPDYLTIYLGKYNIHSDENTSQKRKVNDLKVNPKYNKANFHDDIAILSLTSDVDFTNYVRPICLWEAVDGIEDVVGKEGYVVGWGYNEHQQLNEELKMAPMPIVSADKCARSDAAFFAEYVSENAFCAGYKNGTGPCKGDSGGGLVIKRNNAWFLRGIVSVSAAPKNGSVCNTYHYIVFTDVAKYNDFIRRNL